MLKLLIWGAPATKIYETGETLSNWYSIPYYTIEVEPYEGDSYFDDKIPNIPFDTGDLQSGSASQNMNRDPKSLAIENELKNTKVNPNLGVYGFLSDEEISTIMNTPQAIVVSQIPDNRLIEWSTHVVFLNNDEKKVVDWFSKKRSCRTCRSEFHLEDRPVIINELICPKCGTDLGIPDDAKPEYIRAQFKNFRLSHWRFKETASASGKLRILNSDRYKDLDSLVRQLDSYYGKFVEDNKSHIVETMREGL
jgi:hypothetical protein